VNTTTTALVGATGGAGTTRLCVEFAALLAREGEDVCVLDAAYATQGLAQYVTGRIDPDVTALCVEERPLTDGLADPFFDAPGRVAFCPAFAPFERVARAKTPDAAREFERRVDEAAERFDRVLLDVPPVAANQSVAAATTADRRVLVTPDTRRGADALPRMAGRLRDVDAPADVELSNRGDAVVERADVHVPAGPDGVGDAPAVFADETFAEGVAAAAEVVFGVEVEREASGLLGGLL
jgi:cellulose biosynthesis protein BcsQ